MVVIDPINTTIPAVPSLIEPIVQTFTSLLEVLKYLVGGLFGLYVIFFLYRVITFA